MEDPITKETLSELMKKHYIKLHFPFNHQYISETVGLFFKFLSLPEDVKSHIDFKVSPMHHRGELGYRSRLSTDDIYNDDKEFFHFHPILFEQFLDFIQQNQLINEFFLRANELWKAVFEKMHQIINVFEQDYPGCASKIFNQEAPHIILRFLKYSWQNSGQYLAKPHFDSGSFTFALGESTSGLRIGSGPDDLELINHEDNQAIFFVSSNYKKIINNDKLSPAWHDVIQLDESILGHSYSRWAVVAFIDGNNVTSLSRNQTHLHTY